MFSFSHPVHENNALRPSQSKILLAAEPAAEPPTPLLFVFLAGVLFQDASASAASACSSEQSLARSFLRVPHADIDARVSEQHIENVRVPLFAAVTALCPSRHRLC